MESPLIGTTIAGRYRIVRKLGEGGQSEVFVAVQEGLGREVAVKVIRAELAADPEQIERFKREAAVISELQHPHIVTLHDFGVDGVQLYMAMELCKGESLRERINRGPIPVAETVSIIRDALGALHAAHTRGLVHRDLKPENIFLCDNAGRKEFVKILDFGIAKRHAENVSLTMQGMVVGTPGYIAPETTAGGVIGDARADLYALGAIWWEMLAGRSVFQADTPIALVVKHVTDAPPSFASIGVTVPPPVDQLISLLLEKDPILRPASAEAALARLEAADAQMRGPITGAGIPAPVLPSSSASSSSGPAVFSPPPAAPEKKGLSFAGCLMMGCGVVVLGAVVVVGGSAFGAWHLFKEDTPVAVRPPLPVPPPPPVVAPPPPTPVVVAPVAPLPVTPVVAPVIPKPVVTPTPTPVVVKPAPPPPRVVKPAPPPPPPPPKKKIDLGRRRANPK
ncbi:MAG: serine/threonine-protein kinase [Deltaproteobacteria bacterium]|nr:serine/threonine-protein kinase [Deltaproteobacteria bacterium]